MENSNKFNLHFKWIGAATWVLRINELKIACDPVLCPKGTLQTYAPGFKSKRLTEPVFDKDDFAATDLWLISHEHEDHLDKPGLAEIDPGSLIVANKKSKKILQTIHPEKLNIVKPDQVLSFQVKGMDIEIKTMPAVHASNPLTAFFLGGGNGYFLTIKEGKKTLKIYITGDTTCHKKVLTALNGYTADILIPNVGAAFKNAFGGPFTFSIESLRPVIETIRPDLIFPVHFGSFSHFGEPASAVQNWADDRVKIAAEGDSFQQ